jgi:hypothetical protein
MQRPTHPALSTFAIKTLGDVFGVWVEEGDGVETSVLGHNLCPIRSDQVDATERSTLHRAAKIGNRRFGRISHGTPSRIRELSHG